jgi:hypothetical protein
MHTPAILNKVVKPINVTINCDSKVRKWAYENAYTLTFLSVLFVVTWTIIVMINIVLA